MNTLIRLKKTTPVLVIAFVLAWFALSPTAQAVVPPPDGGYPNFNTAEGQNALFSLTTGVANSAVGWFSLRNNTDGSFNTGVGAGTLLFNVGDQTTFEGTRNTAIGTAALLSNTTGFQNTGIGALALLNNTTGDNNTANGFQALYRNITGDNNTANGFRALYSNTTGFGNTATGNWALIFNTTGNNNTASGDGALVNNTTGVNNIGLGSNAGSAITSGTDIIAIGANVDGVSVGGQLDNSCYIGNIKDAQIDGTTASAVMVDQDGKLGTTVFSSQQFKKEIRPMGQTSEAVLALKPVMFRYKHDKKDAPQFGLIAEEVAAVNPDLVVRDKNGQALAIRYDQVNAMLLNEFLKEHRKNEEQQKQIEALTTGLQKVSAQLEASKPASQVVNNP